MLRVRFALADRLSAHRQRENIIFISAVCPAHQGVMILRIDDTDVGRNTQSSLDSIFEGLEWLNLSSDEVFSRSPSAWICTGNWRE